MSSAFTAIPTELLAAFRKTHAQLPAGYSLKAFNPHQNATVIAMADLIIPATETPGAKDLWVNQFIDHIVDEWFTDDERAGFLAGLDEVDVRTQNLFQKTFVEASPAQQAEILRYFGDEMAAAAAAVANDPRPYRGAIPEPRDNFYLMFRKLTLTGYFTSEVGFTQQLHEEIIPGHYDSCVLFDSSAPPKGR